MHTQHESTEHRLSRSKILIINSNDNTQSGHSENGLTFKCDYLESLCSRARTFVTVRNFHDELSKFLFYIIVEHSVICYVCAHINLTNSKIQTRHCFSLCVLQTDVSYQHRRNACKLRMYYVDEKNPMTSLFDNSEKLVQYRFSSNLLSKWLKVTIVYRQSFSEKDPYSQPKSAI